MDTASAFVWSSDSTIKRVDAVPKPPAREPAGRKQENAMKKGE